MKKKVHNVHLRGPTPKHKLYVACHHHEYGDTMYVFWSDHVPNEGEVSNRILESPFEPEKDEWLVIEEAGKVKCL